MKLLITEKPSVAREFAKVLKVDSKNKGGYMESNGWIITWCVGHLVTMSYPEKYDEKLKQWRLDTLPFMPKEYKYEVIENVQADLFAIQDLAYRDFQAKLMPTVNKETVIGVRTPSLRAYAKKFGKTDNVSAFLEVLPHKYYEENNLHGLLIEQIKAYPSCIAALDRFLPYIDNWATCDMIALRTVKNHLDIFIQEVCRWIASDHPYIVRFGIGMLMRYYLDEQFKPEYPKKVAEVKSDEYYVNMMRAWYFATALAKQYDQIIPYLEEKRLDTWTHNKTIQKAIESYRITPEQKIYLRTLRVKK